MTFDFETTITSQISKPILTWPSQTNIGNPLHLSVSFDSGAALTCTRNDGNGDLVDGLTFQLRDINDPNVESIVQLTPRGSTLDLNHSSALPTRLGSR